MGGITGRCNKICAQRGGGAETAYRLSNAARRIPQLQSDGAEINNTRLLWLDLHRTIIEAGSVPMAQNAWRNWRENNSRHSAAKLPPTPLQRLQNYRPPKISVLLPLSGRLTPVGNAVRNGFVTGYLADLSPREPTQAGAADITFFDSNQHDDLALVALSEDIDSDVIVGPIVKDRALGVLNVLSTVTQTPQQKARLRASCCLIVSETWKTQQSGSRQRLSIRCRNRGRGPYSCGKLGIAWTFPINGCFKRRALG